MMIDELLEELIKISKQTKTDFALYLNMTPSGLSQILSCKTLPSIKERKNFTSKSADYFAEAIYSKGCYLKFENIFPIIYDFSSLEEFKEFLVSAIVYALDMSYLTEYKLNSGFSDKSMYYLGKNSVINMLCIILSDYVLRFPDENLDCYTYFPLNDSNFSSIIKDIQFIGIKNSPETVLNYYFYNDPLSGTNNLSVKVLLSFISGLEKYFDLNFYEIHSPIEPFILLRGQLLLLFNTEINGYPALFPFFNKSYLSIFYNSLLKKGTKKISYNQDESIKFLTKNPGFIPKLLEEEIKSVYNFAPIGYLLTREELNDTGSSPIICHAIFELFNNILGKNPIFIMSLPVLNSFSNSGNVFVPLIGVISLTPENRIKYIQRFNDYLYENSFSQLKAIDSDLDNVTVLFTEEFCLVHTNNNTLEKIHVFQNPWSHYQLYNDLMENDCLVMDFSSELWNAYQDKLQNIGNEAKENP